MSTNNTEQQPIPREFLDWAEEQSLKEFLKWEIDSVRDRGIWLKAAKRMAIDAYRKLTETKAPDTELLRDIISRAERYLREMNDGNVHDPSVGLFRDENLIKLIGDIDELPPIIQ